MKAIIPFPDTPNLPWTATSYLIWKQNDRISIINNQQVEPPVEQRNRDLPGLKALVVTHDSQGIIYIREQSKLLGPKTYNIFRSPIRYKDDDDQFSIKEADAGIKLNVPLGDDNTYNIAVKSSDFQTQVLIAHCNGKVEEVTML